MPRELVFKGYRIIIYFKDHAPAHVHVTGHGKSAKIEIVSLEVVKSRGFRPHELGLLVQFIAINADYLMRRWDEIQEK